MPLIDYIVRLNGAFHLFCMFHSQQNYLHTFRRKSYLTQRDIALLLGIKSGTSIARFEHNTRLPNIRMLFALMVIFNVSAEELFPALYAQVQEETQKRIQIFVRKATNPDRSRKVEHKLNFLKEVINSSNNNV